MQVEGSPAAGGLVVLALALLFFFRESALLFVRGLLDPKLRRRTQAAQAAQAAAQGKSGDKASSFLQGTALGSKSSKKKR